MAILDAILGGINAASDIGKTAWDIYAQNKTWDREDSAVQRRVNDLRQAGLSPTLAAGSAAATSSPIAINKPDIGADIMEPRMQAQLALKQKQDIAQSAADIDLKNQQAQLMKRENEVNRIAGSIVNANGVDGIHQEAFAKVQNILSMRDQLTNQAQKSLYDAEAAQYNRDLTATNSAQASYDYKMLQDLGLTSKLPQGVLGQSVGAGELIHKLLNDIRGSTTPKDAAKDATTK